MKTRCAIWMLSTCLLGFAQDAEKFSISGFGTLGLAKNSTGKAEFVRDLAQPKGLGDHWNGRLDSRLGLQGQYAFKDNLQATVQLVSRYNEKGAFTPQVAWAFLDYRPAPDTQVRVGRLGFDVYMNADSRDVGYSYSGVRPSTDFFGLLPITRFDGLDVTQNVEVSASGLLKIKAFAGRSCEKIPVVDNSIFDLTDGPMAGLITEYSTDAWLWRLSYGRLKMKHNFEKPFTEIQDGLNGLSLLTQEPTFAASAEMLNMKDKVMHFWSGGVNYNPGPFQFMGLVSRYETNAVMQPDYWAGLVSLGYRWGQWMPYGGWSRVVTGKPTVPAMPLLEGIPYPEVQVLNAGLKKALSFTHNDQYTHTLGIRWDFARQACLKLQVDRIQTKGTAGLWIIRDEAWRHRATITTFSLDFVF